MYLIIFSIFSEKKKSTFGQKIVSLEILYHDDEDYDDEGDEGKEEDAADADTDDDWRPLGGLGALVNKMMTR